MERRRLLLLVAPADHPHRDAACATLAWVAEQERSLFECYFAAPASGGHFGGGHPAHSNLADQRGGTLIGGRHLEQLAILLQRFQCEVASLGPSPFDQFLRDAEVSWRSDSADIAEFYSQLFDRGTAGDPDTLLVVGDGGKPQGVTLSPYSFPEIHRRRLLGIADRDAAALEALRRNRRVETLWADAVPGATRIETPAAQSVAEQTAWMAARQDAWALGVLIGDPELVARWIPAGARNRWTPVFGIPQTAVIERMAGVIGARQVVHGRQQDDRDFLALSQLGTAFQLVDPARPVFPVLGESPGRWPGAPRSESGAPSDEQLERWADEGRILTTILFWTGMAREVENLYGLADVLSLTGARAGLILTTESLAYMRHPPLSMVTSPKAIGGLHPNVEILLASAGTGALFESVAPHDRFASGLSDAVRQLRCVLGQEGMPGGWWPVLDTALVPQARSRIGMRRKAPFLQIRYRPRRIDATAGDRPDGAAPSAGTRVRTALRNSPLHPLFEAERPFDSFAPGAPSKAVLETVREQGFRYALTKAAAGAAPTTVRGVDGLTVINHTVGGWGGWTPFVTVDSLDDLRRAERRLLRRRRPGWLLGTLDSCLWSFSGPVWRRGAELHQICEWIAAGGSAGRLVNATPEVVARYARVLERRGQVATVESV